MSQKRRLAHVRSHKSKPRQLCELVQLYLHAQQLSVVISSLSYGEQVIHEGIRYDSSDIPDLYQELSLILKQSEEKSAKLALPRWNDLDTAYKQAIRVAHMGTLPDAVFITINLDSDFANAGFKNKRGLALRTGDTIRRELLCLGAPDFVVLNLEESHGRIKNSPFHVHGIALIPVDLRKPVLFKLRERLSGDYTEHAGNQAALLKSIHTPGRLAGYICKDILQALPSDNRRSYASKSLAEPSRLFYEELRRWCLQVPELRDRIRPELPARPPQTENSTKLQELVAQKLEQIKEQKARKRRDAAALRRNRSQSQRLPGVAKELNSTLETTLQNARKTP